MITIDDFCIALDPEVWTIINGAVNCDVQPGYFTMLHDTIIQATFPSNFIDICFGPSVIQGGDMNPTQYYYLGLSDDSDHNIILWVYPYLETLELRVPGAESFSTSFSDTHLYVRLYVNDTGVHVLLDNYSSFSDPITHIISPTVFNYRTVKIGGWIMNNVLTSFSLDYVKNIFSNRSQSNPMDGGTPVSSFSLCDIDHGVELQAANYWRIILLNLRDALIAYQHLEPVIIQTLSIVMPSSLALPLIVDGIVVDFIPEETRYWAWTAVYKGYSLGAIPLPRAELSDNFFQSVLAPINQPIEGSENNYFRDTDGIIKRGSDMSPIRYYHPLSDGAKDGGLIALVIGVAYLINKLGLVKIAIDFCQRVFSYIRTRKLRASVNETEENVMQLLENSETFSENLESINTGISGVRNAIGLRFTLRT